MSEIGKKALRVAAAALALGLLGDGLLRATPWGANVALWVAARPLVCAAIALGTFLLEASAPLVVVFPGFAWGFVPAALAFHLGILLAIGYFFPSLPLLLLLLDWDALGRRLLPARQT